MSDLRRAFFGAMGTRVEVTVPGDADRDAEVAVQRVFAVREAALSRFLPGSDLCRLNAAAGRPAVVGPLLLDAVERALLAARATGGAFDPALGAQIAALGYDRTFSSVDPDDAATPARPPRPGGAWRRVVVDRERSRVTLPAGTALDLGGIAKGMAVNAALVDLRRAGVPTALVSAGGDLAVIGLPPGRTGWRVAVTLPGGEVPVTLTRGALATSGLARRAWRRAGAHHHHLIDPATGASAGRGVWSASAVAGSCEQAEVAATAAFVLGPGAGARMLTAHGLAGLIATPTGATLPIGAWPAAAEAA